LLSKEIMTFGYWVLDYVATICIRLKFTPNGISLFSILLVFTSSVFLVQECFQWAGLFFLFSCSCDTLDGRVALRTGVISEAGQIVDSTVDRWVDIIVFSGCVILYREYTLELCISLLALAANFMVSYASAKALIYKIEIPRGLMRRVERTVYILFAILLTPFVDWVFHGLRLPFGDRHPLLLLTLFLIGVLGNWSAISRLRILYFKLKE